MLIEVCSPRPQRYGCTEVTNHPGSISISRDIYLLRYQDGTRKHIDRETRDNLELSGQIVKTAPLRYKFIGQMHTYHSLQDLSRLAIFVHNGELCRFLAGWFIFVLYGTWFNELMQTPEGLALQIARQQANGPG